MSTTSNIGSNSSFVSIRYASSKEVLPDANGHTKTETICIDIAALRGIRQIVEQIRARIAAGGSLREGDDQQDYPTANRGGSTTPGSNFGKNSNPEENK